MTCERARAFARWVQILSEGLAQPQESYMDGKVTHFCGAKDDKALRADFLLRFNYNRGSLFPALGSHHASPESHLLSR